VIFGRRMTHAVQLSHELESDPQAPDGVAAFLTRTAVKWETDPVRREIAIAAALPRLLNQDVLPTITPADKTSGLFGWLRRLPFVSQRGQSWAYHDVVRAARGTGITWASPDWVDYTREQTYHLLCGTRTGTCPRPSPQPSWQPSTAQSVPASGPD
jgi:hypothetical protein